MVVTWIALILSIFMMEKIHGQIRMVWSGSGKRSKKCEWEGEEKRC